MNTIVYGTNCLVTRQVGDLVNGWVISNHPEVGAVTVRVSGQDWIVRYAEIIKPGDSELSWREWLRTFKDKLHTTAKLTKAGAPKINKAEAARQLKQPYQRVLNMCQLLESLGINLSPK